MHTRLIWKNLAKEFHTKEIVVITGPRQVGKTTTLHWILEQIPSDNKMYFDMENVSMRSLFDVADYDSLVNEFTNRGLKVTEKLYIAIDEIQFSPNLPSIVKYLYDHYDIKFFLSGSSSFYIKNKFNESMAGRKIIYEMYPLSFQEFLDFHEVMYKLSPLESQEGLFNKFAFNSLQTYYEEYIEFGGLPRVVLTDSVERKKQLLKEAFSSYINLDIQVLADFKSTRNIRKMISLLASRVGNKINQSELGSILGISRPTVNTYIEFLEASYIIKRVPVYTSSSDVKIRKQNKAYFVDNGIANINADLSGGAKFENTVANQLSFYGDIEYYADKHSEIDFIVSKKLAIEVKETPIHKHKDTLEKRAKNIGIKNSTLIGRFQSADFEEYLWGGGVA